MSDHTDCAIIRSSSVAMTRTVVGLASRLMTGAFAAFRSGIDLDPEKAQILARTGSNLRDVLADSAEKTSVSTPPSTAANAPIHLPTW